MSTARKALAAACALLLVLAALALAGDGSVSDGIRAAFRTAFRFDVRVQDPVTDGHVLTFDSATGTWRAEPAAAPSTLTEYVVHSATTAVLPSSQPATTLAVGDHQVLVYGDAAAADAIFEGYGAFASPYVVRITWAAATAAAGDVRWVVQRELTDGQVVGTPGFGALFTATPTVSPAPGTIVTTSTVVAATLTGAYRLRVRRDGADPADTAVGSAYLLRVTLEQQ